jgi:hypothetical protein
MGIMENKIIIGKQKIVVRNNDHLPPHVHIVGGGVNAVVVLRTLEVFGQIKGGEKAIKFVTENSNEYIKFWNTINP